MGRSYNSERSESFFLGKQLSSSHIDEFEVAFPIDHNIFGFEISVDDAFEVQILQGQEETPNIEPADRLGEDTNLSDDVKEL